MSGRLEEPLHELNAALKDPSRPLPTWVYGALAVLLCLVLFLTVRLFAFRTAPPAALPGTPAGSASASASAAGRRAPPAPLPPASPAAFRAFVEGWRRAWVARDLERYMGYYAQSFGAGGRDLAGWREQKARVFASGNEIAVEVGTVEAQLGERIAILSFEQDYRSAGYQDRGLKRLYLLAEDGRWRIFTEEWLSLDAPPSAAAGGR